ncbi:MAG: class I SAM-dependent methyltransferase [Ruminococcaceae bacterium]|nr:class I SAM-dependent methyltransferase [Oscillospiraceae bacterium]
MALKQDILFENKAYWTQRAPSYSEINRSELSSQSRVVWRDTICEQIRARFPGRAPRELRVLEVGTGPGFFAIILTEAGYRVTAVDLTPSMLAEAKKNAGALAGEIEFLEMNAEALTFADESFDVVLSRNLTWDLPHPEDAYREWHRVLKPGGLLLSFDANWYRYLFDEQALAGYEEDRQNVAARGIRDEGVGENFDVMEDIARRIPLSRLLRPAWDRRILSGVGFDVETDERIWERVWAEEEKVNFGSTPMFLIRAVKS